MAGANYVDYAVIALYALLMVRVGFLRFALQPGRGRVFSGREPHSLAGRRTELFHVRL